MSKKKQHERAPVNIESAVLRALETEDVRRAERRKREWKKRLLRILTVVLLLLAIEHWVHISAFARGIEWSGAAMCEWLFFGTAH